MASRLRYHAEERAPFYVKLLEERAAAREKGLLNPFDPLLSYGLPAVPLSAVPTNALLRLSQIGSADLMFPRLFTGEPGDGFLGWGVCSLQAASVEDPSDFRYWFVERACSLEGAERAQDLARVVLVRGRGGLKFDPKPVQPFGRPYSDPVVQFYNEVVGGQVDSPLLLARYRRLLRELGEDQVVEADVKDPLFASRDEGVSPSVETLNIDALGVRAYLAAVWGRFVGTSQARAEALRERFQQHPQEKLPFYLRLLEERDSARQDGTQLPYEGLAANPELWSDVISLAEVPESALRRLASFKSADPLVHSLFSGVPEASPYRFGVESLQAASIPNPSSFRAWFYQRAVRRPSFDHIAMLQQAVIKRRRGGLPFKDDAPIGLPTKDYRVQAAVHLYNDCLKPGSNKDRERELLNERYLQAATEAMERGVALRGEDLMRIAGEVRKGDPSAPPQFHMLKNREGAVGLPFVPKGLPPLDADEVLGTAPSKAPREPWEEDELGFALRMGAVDALATKAAERLGLPTGDLSKAVGYALLGAAFDLGGHLGRPGLSKLAGALGPAMNVWGAARGVGALATILESLLPTGSPEAFLSGVRMVAEEAGAVTGEPGCSAEEGKGRRAQH